MAKKKMWSGSNITAATVTIHRYSISAIRLSVNPLGSEIIRCWLWTFAVPVVEAPIGRSTRISVWRSVCI